MLINAKEFEHADLNSAIKSAGKNCKVMNCLGERFIGAGMSDISIEVYGIAGNALGTYLNGAEIITHGNAQDAVGDTMNDGKIIIHGSTGDAVGYAMRGGEIYVQKDAGYRAGIHMKEYKEKVPVLVIGGKTGSFLGEYQAGGIIIVLGLTDNDKNIVGNFPAMGMHGGKMFLRSDCSKVLLPERVNSHIATQEDIDEIEKYIDNYCSYFGADKNEILCGTFTVVTPDSENPYKQMYATN